MVTPNPQNPISAYFLVPSLRRAGAETQIIDLVNGLDPLVIKSNLVVFESDLSQLDRVNRERVTFERYHRKSKYGLKYIWNIGKSFERIKPEVVHCTMQFSLLIAWLARILSRYKPKLVVAIHTTLNVGIKEEFQDRLIYRPILRCCEKVIFVCHSQADFWQLKYPELKAKSEVVYNGIDTSYFCVNALNRADKNLREELNIPPNAKVMACVAGFRREKGHRYLLEALSRLREDIYLLLAGDGECRKDLEKQAIELGVCDRVNFLGNVSDVRPLLYATDISVLASTSVETFSMAMLESMSMGVPVVATDIGGLKEAVISGRTGKLVPPGDSATLAQALEEMLSNDQRLVVMGNNARNLVEEKFSLQDMVSKTQHILVSI